MNSLLTLTKPAVIFLISTWYRKNEQYVCLYHSDTDLKYRLFEADQNGSSSS
jgi:hypothetical protein